MFFKSTLPAGDQADRPLLGPFRKNPADQWIPAATIYFSCLRASFTNITKKIDVLKRTQAGQIK